MKKAILISLSLLPIILTGCVQKYEKDYDYGYGWNNRHHHKDWRYEEKWGDDRWRDRHYRDDNNNRDYDRATRYR